MGVPDVSISHDEYPFLSEYTFPVKKLERELVGRKDEMRSLMAGMMRPELCNIILLAEAGSGKALANGTEIPLYRGADGQPGGYRRIEDLREGDLVFDERGDPVRVAGVFPQGRKRAYRVNFSDGTWILCNDEHLWTARNQYRHYAGKPYRTYTLRQMLEDGIHMPNGSSRWYVPIGGAVKRDEAALPADPYLVGALLGGGCVAMDGSVRFFVDDPGVLSRIGEAMGLGPLETVDTECGSGFVRASGGGMVSWPDFAEGGVLEEAVKVGRVPEPYKTASVPQREALLRGLMDGGGDVQPGYRGSCVFHTYSGDMAWDVREVAASLGIRTEEQGVGRRRQVRFVLDPARKRDLFTSGTMLAKLDRYQFRQGGRPCIPLDDLCIKSVEDLGGDVDMTCIYVDSPSHLFQAGRAHIVTHNTALVQGTMSRDKGRLYLEVDLAKMISNLKDPNEMAAKLKTLFYETGKYVEQEKREIVLFIDEFHQIVQLSAAAVEALKPLLADSGTRGIRVIAATTYAEFQEFISPNQPLVERLQRMNLVQPDKAVTVAILRGMAERYQVADQFPDDSIFELIYDYTNRYVPASSQPRKSLATLDAMIGWHRSENRKMDQKLLADVIHESQGVNVAFRVDAASIKARLDERVLSQQLATTMLEQRLQICVADLNDKSRPMSSFLFCGSTGTGKANVCSSIVPVFDPSGRITHKKMGDLRVGDFVFNARGLPVEVTGVFPQGRLPVYEVELADGRTCRCSGEHIWTYQSRKGGPWRQATAAELMGKLEGRQGRGRLVHYVIPMNGAVRWPERDLPLDPYLAGALLAGGDFREASLSLHSRDRFASAKCAGLLGASYGKARGSLRWVFTRPGETDRIRTEDVLSGSLSGLRGVDPDAVRIPDDYKYSGEAQRWELIRGIFDLSGHIAGGGSDRFGLYCQRDGRGLLEDVMEVLFSLGVSSTIRPVRDGMGGFRLRVQSSNRDKGRFFAVPRKLATAELAGEPGEGRSGARTFGDTVGVRDIRRTDREDDMVCIMVDDPDHLYQAEHYVVTHNTEMTKSLAEILFEDSRNLIRIDCTEYANPDSLERFRRELTARVWERPYSIVLLDEIEKACAPVTRILLQVLDDGRLSDANGRQVSFVNAYFVMTTNAGSEIFRTIGHYNADDTGSGTKLKRYDKLIRSSIAETTGDNRFPPELLGRIDCIVPFQPLSDNTMKAIARMKLTRLKADVMQKHGISVRFHPDVVRYLVEDNLDTDANSGGARILASKLESEVTTALSRYINEHPDDKSVGVVIKGKMAADHKDMLESKAYVSVEPDRGR